MPNEVDKTPTDLNTLGVDVIIHQVVNRTNLSLWWALLSIVRVHLPSEALPFFPIVVELCLNNRKSPVIITSLPDLVSALTMSSRWWRKQKLY